MKKKMPLTGKELTARLAQHRSAITAVFGIVLLYAVLFLLGITCPIKFLTGVSCAGCGMTRAFLRLLHLDFAGAWGYHPLVFLLPPGIPAVLLRKRYPKLFRGVFLVGCLLFLGVYLLRMFDPACKVVVFEPKNGAVYRAASFLFDFFRSFAQ